MTDRHDRLFQAFRFVMILVALGCAGVYAYGCIWFHGAFGSLLTAGFNNPDAGLNAAGDYAVQSRFREFPWLDAASIASIFGVVALLVVLSLRSWRAVYIPGRFMSQLLLIIGYSGLVNDAGINADIVSLDHNAVGLLRYYEDSWNPIYLVLLATIPVLLLAICGFWSGAMNRRWRTPRLRDLNPIFVVLALAILVCMALFTPSNVFYDAAHAHSSLGIGSGLLCTYGMFGIIMGNAFRAGEKRGLT